MINVLKYKFDKPLVIINTVLSIIYFGLIFALRNNLVWGINDDFVLDQIINNQSDLNNSIVSFMTLLLGFLLSIATKITSYTHWLGLFLIVSNWLIILLLTKLFLKYKTIFNKIISIFILFLIVPYLILNPTYTITSILISFVGLQYLIFGLTNYINSYKFYLFYGIVLAIGFSVRLDSYKGIIVFLGIYLVVLLFYFYRNLNIKYLILGILPSILILLVQFGLTLIVASSSPKNNEYLNFQNIRHELFYTPAILKLHQNVIANEVLPEIWGDVEFTIFRNWFYPDQSVFNSTNFEIGKDSVKEYIGIKGFINSNQIDNFKTLVYYLSNIKLILFFILITFIISTLLTRNLKKNLILNLSLILGYLISFLYAAAVLRLPIRVTFPYLIILGLLFIFNLEITQVKKITKNLLFLNFIFIFFVALSIWFNSQKSFGFKFLFELNQDKRSWANQRNNELINFSREAVFVGPMVHLPAAQSGPFSNEDNLDSLKNSLVLDWSTFSPSWRMRALNLGLDPKNIFFNLAKTKDVYLISEPGLASVIEMYMNDHNILRGKLCPLINLNGYDNAKIFTFQAKENAC